MGKLLRIDLENFKSYGGKQSVGPFMNFTCVVGPNGSGKSNLMDAISFVLGVQSKQLRTANLKELLFRKDESAQPARRASVQLVYSMSEDERDKNLIARKLVKDTNELIFQRVINATGSSTYKLQGNDVSFDEYINALNSIGVLVKARNFLVFQGDVESIASKSPIDLTKWVEHISESDQLAQPYDEAKKRKSQAQDSAISALQTRKMFVGQCREVKEQKDEADLYQSQVQELKNVQTNQILWKIWNSLKGLSKHRHTMGTLRKNLGVVGEESDIIVRQISDIRRDSAHESFNATREKKLLQMRKDFNAKKGRINAISAKEKSIQKRLVDIRANQKKTEFDIQERKRVIQEIEAKAVSISIQMEAVKNNLDAMSFTSASMNEEQRQRYSQLREVAASRINIQLTELKTVQLEVQSLQKQQSMLDLKQRRLHDDRQYSLKMLEEIEEAKVKNEGALKSIEQTIESSQKQRNALQDKEKKDRISTETLTRQLNVVDEKLRNAGDDRRLSKQEQRLNEAVETMQTIFPGVYGRLHDLCRPIQKQYGLAIQVAAGKYMNSVVVDNTKTASDCIRYLREQRIGVLPFLPLDNLRETPIPERYRSFGQQFKPCIDLISCDDIIRPAASFAFDRALVCDNLDSARKLCYEKGEVVKVVTMEGHIIHRSGSMTGGVGKETANIWEAKEIEQLQKEKSDLEDKLSKFQHQGSIWKSSMN